MTFLNLNNIANIGVSSHGQVYFRPLKIQELPSFNILPCHGLFSATVNVKKELFLYDFFFLVFLLQ